MPRPLLIRQVPKTPFAHKVIECPTTSRPLTSMKDATPAPSPIRSDSVPKRVPRHRVLCAEVQNLPEGKTNPRGMVPDEYHRVPGPTVFEAVPIRRTRMAHGPPKVATPTEGASMVKGRIRTTKIPTPVEEHLLVQTVFVEDHLPLSVVSRRRSGLKPHNVEKQDVDLNSVVVGNTQFVVDQVDRVLPTDERHILWTRSDSTLEPAGTEVKQDNKGKGRATEDINGADSPSNVCSSPPAVPIHDFTLQLVPEADDISSTSSIYGDENFLPSPIVSSLPNKSCQTTSLLVTPPKPLYCSSDPITPPSPYGLRTGIIGPTDAGPSSLSFALTRRRAWESSSRASSPQHPLSQCETLRTTCESPTPLHFEIYEDSDHTTSPIDPEWISAPRRGDTVAGIVAVTPIQAPGRHIKLTRKRTGSGGKASDGKTFGEPCQGQNNEGERCSSDLSDLRQNAIAAHESKPKRQKHEQDTILTRELLELAPRRRRSDKGRLVVGNVPPVDDLGEDVTREGEEEVSKLVNGRKGVVRKCRSRTLIDGGTATASTKAQSKSLSLPKSTIQDTGYVEIKVARKPATKIYGCDESPSGVHGNSNGPATLARGDQENDYSGKTGTGVSLEREGSKVLENIKKAFEKVDQWQMEFEDINTEGSSEV